MISSLKQPAEPSVAPGPNAFQQADLRILPFELDARQFQPVFDPTNTFLRFSQRNLGSPLKRCVRFGNKGCNADVYLAPATLDAFYPAQVFNQVDQLADLLKK